MYNPQMASQYYPQMMYGATATSNIGHQPYNYPQMNYMMASPRTGFPPSMMQSQQAAAHRQLPYGHNPMAMPHIDMDGSYFPPSTLSHGLQLQLPPHVRQSLTTPDSQTSQPTSTNGGNNEGSDV
ncbi:uncharacterized protein LOC110036409 [Phalaenopsis equestris]|nr:uncharacterized protein LOC110032446 [Phalaenopsis equestris]XP_020596503.1 uncharacterized protein LOC110036409 [Phalaenopsis equestris]